MSPNANLIGLACLFLVSMLACGILNAARDSWPAAIRVFHRWFPRAAGVLAASASGMVAGVVPTLDPAGALLVGGLVGYLALRVTDECINGRPRVFAPGEEVVVPSDWG